MADLSNLGVVAIAVLLLKFIFAVLEAYVS